VTFKPASATQLDMFASMLTCDPRPSWHMAHYNLLVGADPFYLTNPNLNDTCRSDSATDVIWPYMYVGSPNGDITTHSFTSLEFRPLPFFGPWGIPRIKLFTNDPTFDNGIVYTV